MLEHITTLLKAVDDTMDLGEKMAYIKAAAILIEALEKKKGDQHV